LDWLRNYESGKFYNEDLSECSGKELLSLSKQDLVTVLGLIKGSVLFNTLHDLLITGDAKPANAKPADAKPHSVFPHPNVPTDQPHPNVPTDQPHPNVPTTQPLLNAPTDHFPSSNRDMTHSDNDNPPRFPVPSISETRVITELASDESCMTKYNIRVIWAIVLIIIHSVFLSAFSFVLSELNVISVSGGYGIFASLVAFEALLVSLAFFASITDCCRFEEMTQTMGYVMWIFLSLLQVPILLLVWTYCGFLWYACSLSSSCPSLYYSSTIIVSIVTLFAFIFTCICTHSARLAELPGKVTIQFFSSNALASKEGVQSLPFHGQPIQQLVRCRCGSLNDSRSLFCSSCGSLVSSSSRPLERYFSYLNCLIFKLFPLFVLFCYLGFHLLTT
jgi:hypothetical protein